jgi:hypothetical protein
MYQLDKIWYKNIWAFGVTQSMYLGVIKVTHRVLFSPDTPMYRYVSDNAIYMQAITFLKEAGVNVMITIIDDFDQLSAKILYIYIYGKYGSVFRPFFKKFWSHCLRALCTCLRRKDDTTSPAPTYIHMYMQGDQMIL